MGMPYGIFSLNRNIDEIENIDEISTSVGIGSLGCGLSFCNFMNVYSIYHGKKLKSGLNLY